MSMLSISKQEGSLSTSWLSTHTMNLTPQKLPMITHSALPEDRKRLQFSIRVTKHYSNLVNTKIWNADFQSKQMNIL